MKTIQFSILKKRCIVESTGNPNYYKVIIDTANSYKCYRLPAVNVQSAIYHATVDALGVR